MVLFDKPVVIGKGVEWVEADGEILLLDLKRGCLFGLNDTGSLIWKYLVEGLSVNRIIHEIDREFDDETETLQAAVVDFVATLKEAELLLCCAQADADVAGEQIERLLEYGIDSDYLLQLARQHAMVQLLYRSLHAACPKAVPAPLRYEHQINALRSQFLAREVLRVVTLLQTHDISAVPYKGPALASFVYGDMTLRQSSDLDILVQAQDVRQVINLLLQEGYQTQEQWSPQQEEYLLYHKGEYNFISRNNIVVEIHWQFVEPYLAVPVDYGRLWQRVTKIPFCGQEILAPCPEDLLLALCVHGIKHTWRQLNWICDIAALIRSYPQLDWQDLLHQARLSGSRRLLLLGLAIADSLIGLELPHPVRQRMSADQAAITLAKQTCQWLFQEPRHEMNVVLYHIQAKERLRDQLYYRANALLLVTRP